VEAHPVLWKAKTAHKTEKRKFSKMQNVHDPISLVWVSKSDLNATGRTFALTRKPSFKNANDCTDVNSRGHAVLRNLQSVLRQSEKCPFMTYKLHNSKINTDEILYNKLLVEINVFNIIIRKILSIIQQVQ